MIDAPLIPILEHEATSAFRAVAAHLEDRAADRERYLGTIVRDRFDDADVDRHEFDRRCAEVRSALVENGFHASEDEIAQRACAVFPGTAPSGPRRSGVVAQIALFVATSVGSGVIGNFAYDALKKAFAVRSRLFGGRTRTADPEALLAHLAKAAVIKQCHRHTLPVPRYEDLRTTRWTYGRDGATTTVTSRDGRLHAKVYVGTSAGDPLGGVTVLLRQILGPDGGAWTRDRARQLLTSPAFVEIRSALERLGSEPLDQRGVERSLRMVTSDAVSLHDLAPAVERALRQLRDAAPDRYPN